MTTDEAAMILYRDLSAPDRAMVGALIKKLALKSRKKETSLPKLSRKQIIADVELSHEQIKNNKTKSAWAVSKDIAREYDF